MDFKFNLVT